MLPAIPAGRCRDDARLVTIPGTIFRVPRAFTALMLLACAVPSLAQQPTTEAPTTREEAIAVERADKVAELWPERQSPLVDTVNRLVERGFNEGLDSGQGSNGPQIVLGGMRPGQGFTAGLGYRRSDLWAERLGYRATARGTLQGAYLFDFNLDFQGLQDRARSRQVVHEVRELSGHRLLRAWKHVAQREPHQLCGTTT